MRVRTTLPPSITNSPIISPQNPEEKCISLLKSVTHIRQFNQILAFFFTNGLKQSSFLATKLVDLCNSSHQMYLASSIFHQIPHPNSFLWTAMIRGFSQNGLHHQSLLFYTDMRRRCTDPNHLTYPFVLKACSGLNAFSEGEQFHTHVVKSGFLPDIYVLNSILDMYSKCGFIDKARILFDEMPVRDVVSHTSMISGYFSVGDVVSAQSIFDQVEGEDIVLWSAMIAGYAQNRSPDKALDMFDQMQSFGVRPNAVTMVSVVSAASQLGDCEWGRWAHEFIVRSGLEKNIAVSTSLIDMYITGGFINEARELFDRIPKKDIVSWNCLINGYAKNGYAKESLEVFEEMQDLGLAPNRVTFLGVLSSCGQLGALERGKEIECLLDNMGIGSNLSIETALLDMYAKCGNLVDAYRVFGRIYPRDVVTWSAMINGYATNGHFEEAISLFGGMLKVGVRPNEVTFVGLLMACSHGGSVNEGFKHFDAMSRDYNVLPKLEHYACMVDVLGRAGRVEEAKRFIDSMPTEPGVSVWGCLLGACTTHNNMEIGENTARHLVEVDPTNDSNYVFLSNIYAATSRWEDVESTRATMRHRGTYKTPGCSWIEVGGVIHQFLVGDRMHPVFLQIFGILNNLSKQLRDGLEQFHLA